MNTTFHVSAYITKALNWNFECLGFTLLFSFCLCLTSMFCLTVYLNIALDVFYEFVCPGLVNNYESAKFVCSVTFRLKAKCMPKKGGLDSIEKT